MRKYFYIAINKETGVPITGGPNKYDLTHALSGGKINPDEVKFYRIREARWPDLSQVTELTLEDIQ